MLDDPEADPWGRCSDLGAARGRAAALVAAAPTAGSRAPSCSRRCSQPLDVAGRPATAPRAFPDAGIALLRTPPEDGPEIWCRCDGGPHGFLSIAAHAHADALSRRGAARRGRRARRPGHLLLPRRARVAELLPVHPGPQHRRGRREQPVRRGRAVPLEHAHARTRDSTRDDR